MQRKYTETEETYFYGNIAVTISKYLTATFALSKMRNSIRLILIFNNLNSYFYETLFTIYDYSHTRYCVVYGGGMHRLLVKLLT